MKLPKGHVFNGPDGQGYRLTRDVDEAPFLAKAADFEPFGGAPPPVSHTSMPKWLEKAIDVEFEAQKHRA